MSSSSSSATRVSREESAKESLPVGGVAVVVASAAVAAEAAAAAAAASLFPAEDTTAATSSGFPSSYDEIESTSRQKSPASLTRREGSPRSPNLFPSAAPQPEHESETKATGHVLPLTSSSTSWPLLLEPAAVSRGSAVACGCGSTVRPDAPERAKFFFFLRSRFLRGAKSFDARLQCPPNHFSPSLPVSATQARLRTLQSKLTESPTAIRHARHWKTSGCSGAVETSFDSFAIVFSSIFLPLRAFYFDKIIFGFSVFPPFRKRRPVVLVLRIIVSLLPRHVDALLCSERCSALNRKEEHSPPSLSGRRKTRRRNETGRGSPM